MTSIQSLCVSTGNIACQCVRVFSVAWPTWVLLVVRCVMCETWSVKSHTHTHTHTYIHTHTHTHTCAHHWYQTRLTLQLDSGAIQNNAVLLAVYVAKLSLMQIYTLFFYSTMQSTCRSQLVVFLSQTLYLSPNFLIMITQLWNQS